MWNNITAILHIHSIGNMGVLKKTQAYSNLRKAVLGELVNVKRGMSLSGEYYATEGNLIRLTLGNFQEEGGFKINTSKDDLYFTGPVREEFVLKEGDIITPLTEQVVGLLGATARIPESDKYIQSGDVALIKCISNEIDDGYCYYLVSSDLVRRQLSAAAQQTKIRHTSPEKIMDCEVFIPEVKDQRKIAKLLDSINKKIELNEKINDNLDAQSQALLTETVTKTQTTRTSLGDIVDFIDGDRGKNYPTFDEFSDTGYCLFLNASNVTSTGFNFDSCQFVTKEKDESLRKGHLSRGDIVLTSRGTLGNVAFYNDSIPFDNVRINSGMLIIRPKNNRYSPIFLFVLLKSVYMKAAIESLKSGSAQPQLPIKDLQMAQFEIPSSDCGLSQLSDKLSRIDNYYSENCLEIISLKSMSSLILSELSSR